MRSVKDEVQGLAGGQVWDPVWDRVWDEVWGRVWVQVGSTVWYGVKDRA